FCLLIPAAAYAASRLPAVTARVSALAAAHSSSPATDTAATPSWYADLFLKWPRRSISAIRAIAARPCCGALGARVVHLGAYQGHGSLGTPHNILIIWAAIMQGGIQVNSDGHRFCDESRGYSEQAADVLRQPDGIAWSVFDERIAGIARQFEDFRNA